MSLPGGSYNGTRFPNHERVTRVPNHNPSLRFRRTKYEAQWNVYTANGTFGKLYCSILIRIITHRVHSRQIEQTGREGRHQAARCVVWVLTAFREHYTPCGVADMNANHQDNHPQKIAFEVPLGNERNLSAGASSFLNLCCYLNAFFIMWWWFHHIDQKWRRIICHEVSHAHVRTDP